MVDGCCTIQLSKANRFAEHFGLGRFEGKQLVAGDSGTKWEIDAKGFATDRSHFIVVECKRHTKAGISQAITAALAWNIQDVGASGGILVSPTGLQEGAKKVAAKSDIIEVVLNQNSTTSDYVLKFLNRVCFGFSANVKITDSLKIEVMDQGENVIAARGI
ncbi:hypothetical protein DB032_12975 [Chromobacterium sp. Panama]|nr:hypothetical protein DB032_12975 [Chromobacterium sp. Panama]